MTICPLISDSEAIMRCHPNCALLTKGGCAIKVLAEAQQRSAQGQDGTHSEKA